MNKSELVLMAVISIIFGLELNKLNVRMSYLEMEVSACQAIN